MSRSANDGPTLPGRRRLLAVLAGALLVACRSAATPPQQAIVQLPLTALPDGGDLRVLLGDVPVVLARAGDRITARSLLCTHQGCEVRFVPGRQQFVCPCHRGTFDRAGRPVAGPVSRPLREVPVRREGGFLVVGPPPAPERGAER